MSCCSTGEKYIYNEFRIYSCSVCAPPPKLRRCILLVHPLDGRAITKLDIELHNELPRKRHVLCKWGVGEHNVLGGGGGGTNGKDPCFLAYPFTAPPPQFRSVSAYFLCEWSKSVSGKMSSRNCHFNNTKHFDSSVIFVCLHYFLKDDRVFPTKIQSHFMV